MKFDQSFFQQRNVEISYIATTLLHVNSWHEIKISKAATNHLTQANDKVASNNCTWLDIGWMKFQSKYKHVCIIHKSIDA